MKKEEYIKKRNLRDMSTIAAQSIFASIASKYIINELKQTMHSKITPMRQVLEAIKNIRTNNSYEASPLLITDWLSKNIDRLLYEEKYLVVDTFDTAKDLNFINEHKKTEGQIFFEKHFINL